MIIKNKLISKSSAPILNKDENFINISVEYATGLLTGQVLYHYNINDIDSIIDTQDNEQYIMKIRKLTSGKNYNTILLKKIYNILKLDLPIEEENDKINLLIMES